MLGHLPADMICSEKRTGADVSWKEQIMPKIKYKKKYPSALLHHIKHANALVKRSCYCLMPQRTRDEGVELLHLVFFEHN